jgi:hypothetical protein
MEQFLTPEDLVGVTRLLILQPTAFCNVDCDYCYLPNRHDRKIMSHETAAAAEPARNASEVVAMQADFRACYRAAVQNHADLAGRVALVLSIAADGHVSDVKAEATSLPGSTVDCLKRRAALARFEPPKGGGAIITVPVTFVKQEND